MDTGFPIDRAQARKRGKRSAERRGSLGPHQRMRRPPPNLSRLQHDPEKWLPVFGQDHAQTRKGGTEGGSPLGAPPRLSPGGFRPFRSAPGQASWDAVAIAFARRALPAPTCPSPVEAPHGPVVVPVSMMPEAARERTVSFRARAPLSLRFREYPRPKASLDERDSRLVTELGTDVKGNVAGAATGL